MIEEKVQTIIHKTLYRNLRFSKTIPT